MAETLSLKSLFIMEADLLVPSPALEHLVGYSKGPEASVFKPPGLKPIKNLKALVGDISVSFLPILSLGTPIVAVANRNPLRFGQAML